jgi:hypothetical protein
MNMSYAERIHRLVPLAASLRLVRVKRRLFVVRWIPPRGDARDELIVAVFPSCKVLNNDDQLLEVIKSIAHGVNDFFHFDSETGLRNLKDELNLGLLGRARVRVIDPCSY